MANLRSLVFNNSSFFYDQVASKFKPETIADCEHKLKECYICPQCHSTKNKVAVIILVRLGLNSPEP